MAGMGTGNLFSNDYTNALVSYNFMLRVEALYDVPCKSIRAFTKENEYETIQEGGLNDYVHLRRKPVSKPFTFQVERYCGMNWTFDPLPNGAQLVLPLLLLVTRYAGRFDLTKRVYIFTGCTVMSKEYGELNSERSGLLSETVTIGYRELLCTDMPWNIETDVWNFDGQNYKGNSKFKARSATAGTAAGITNRSKAEGEAAAAKRKWPRERNARDVREFLR